MDNTIEAALIIDLFSRRAKILADGMMKRVDRLPDAADFKAAFEDELLQYIKRLKASRED